MTVSITRAPAPRTPRDGSLPISALDRMWLGAVTSAVTGPVALPPVADLRAALVEIARLGPQARAGLRLGRGERAWRYDPGALEEYAARVVTEATPPVATAARSGSELMTLAGVADPRGTDPLAVVAAGPFLNVSLRHALGDARLVFGLVSGLVTTATTGVAPDWAREDVVANPLRVALRTFFGSDRGRVGALLRERLAARHTVQAADGAAGPSTPSGEATPFQPDRTLAFARGSDEGRRELLAWRKRTAPDASMAALALLAVRAALREVGIPVDDELLMVYDLRRYLPHRCAVHGNFVSGVRLLPRPAGDPSSVSRLIEHTGDLGRPLAALAAARARGLLPIGTQRVATTAPSRPVARLAYNFMGRAMPIDRLPWSVEPPERVFSAMVEPASPEGISICVIQVAGGLQYGLSFHRTVFDPALVQRACELAADHPRELIERHAC